MLRVKPSARLAGLALLLATAGCGTTQDGGAGAPAVGNTGVPIDLTTASLRALVWSVQSVPPPVAVDPTLLDEFAAVPKPGGGLAKLMVGRECPLVDLLDYDPSQGDPVPDPLRLTLIYQQFDGNRCIAGDEELAGEVEVTLRGVGGLVNGAFIRSATAENLVMTEAYQGWSRKVPEGTGTRTYSFGGARTVTVDGVGVTRTVTEPWVSRRAVIRDVDNNPTGQAFYYYSTTNLTAIPVAGAGGPGTALRRNGTIHVASADDGFFDVTLNQVLYDPAVCGGTPTAGTMTFRAAGLILVADFNLAYVNDPGNNCGLATFQFAGGTPNITNFGDVSPVF